MQIGEFARQAGVRASAVRFYEKRGLMPPPQREANGYRSYGADDLRIVQLIDQARALGFSLSDVKRFMSRPPEDRRDKRRLLPILEEKLACLDQHLAAVRKQREAITAFMARIRE
jgi:DNA-binding transcriptional MerR regulator